MLTLHNTQDSFVNEDASVLLPVVALLVLDSFAGDITNIRL
jgi:hypothetical protein